MKRLTYRKLNLVSCIFILMAGMLSAQVQKKDFHEEFKVNKDVVIDINTSYADLEFDTWNRNEVVVEATIEIEGVSEEEAKKIMDNWNFKAIGNSGKVTISGDNNLNWNIRGDNVFVLSGDNMDFSFNFPEMPELPEMPEIGTLPVPDVPPAPPVPPVPPIAFAFGDMNFDYDAYEKDGEKYLKEWKEKFKANFDEDYKKEMLKWKEEMEKQMIEREKLREEMRVQRDKLREEQEIIRKEQQKVRAEQRDELQRVRKEQMIAAREAQRMAEKEVREAMLRINSGNPQAAPEVYFLRHEGSNKNLKIKRTIKIKAPKGAKLKLNVRHGEIKLAENYRNINATLSYTRLHATVVDGATTVINASYSPVIVDNWKQGELKVNYSREVDLQQVNSIKLLSKSSDVTLGNVSGDAIINGSFGDLKILNLSDSFNTIDIVLDNSEAKLILPNTPFKFYSSVTDSKVSYPGNLKIDVNKRYNNELAKGYKISNSGDKSINLVATFSEISYQ
ncbi:DUF4097 family beta strand repeat-containing protein [Robertkochia solimangrovi]|uniref:DUF4097 family beta strand repeat-containing protein n=1 Tax=Robertkochia solimangrovi TaxID=2213046 RepID=UPI00117BE4FD|nr:DUF4097 family beta strand repeat-containing protein [Robertkochia solimangrovi]TRZ42811.1 hypothetical protein DMZ48_12130 [Robertkochia solimangrovi]